MVQKRNPETLVYRYLVPAVAEAEFSSRRPVTKGNKAEVASVPQGFLQPGKNWKSKPLSADNRGRQASTIKNSQTGLLGSESDAGDKTPMRPKYSQSLTLDADDQ
jgi:hypothetical protein